MSPTTSSLLLNDYFTEELFIKANAEHEPENPFSFSLDDITVSADALASKKKSDGWQVRLTIFHQTEGKSNSPYSFRISIVGFFNVDSEYPADKAEWLIRTNAPSVLYSIARDIIKRNTAEGPWRSLILPTVSFYTEELKAMIKKKSASASTDAKTGKKN